MKLDTFLNLLTDAFLWTAVGGVKSLVATEGAAAGTQFSVTVGTAEASVDAKLLHSGAE